jgi:hypothetical protein
VKMYLTVAYFGSSLFFVVMTVSPRVSSVNPNFVWELH